MAVVRSLVVDTNVPVTANGAASQASADCATICRRRLLEITRGKARLVLDDGSGMLDEYRLNLSFAGQPGVGDMFLKWVHDHQYNPERCERVRLTPHPARGFEELPDDPELGGFDPGDRKFAAAARVAAPPAAVLNAVDSDWWDYELPLARQGVAVDFACDDQVAAWREERPQRP